MDQTGESESSGIFGFFCFVLFKKKSIKKNLKFNERADLKDWIS